MFLNCLNTHGIKSIKYVVLYPLKTEKVRANIAPLISSAGASVSTAHTEPLERSITTAPHPLSTPQSAVRSPVRTAALFDNNPGSLLQPRDFTATERRVEKGF